MLCPKCKINLLVSDRQGVEIDHCPTCRGVWLDRGELDKIVERSMAYDATRRNAAGHPDRDDDDDFGFGDRDDARPPRRAPAPQAHQPPYPNEQRRRKSFWEEMFD